MVSCSPTVSAASALGLSKWQVVPMEPAKHRLLALPALAKSPSHFEKRRGINISLPHEGRKNKS